MAGSSPIVKNFDPYIYFGEESPPEKSDWYRWVDGVEPQFDGNFALYCWWSLMQVLEDFICWDRSAKRYKDYADFVGFPVSERGELSLKNELNHALRMAQIAINSVEGYTQQFNIESKIAELAENEKKYIVQIYAACAILAFDSAISGLLSNDAKQSSENFLLAKGCVEIVTEYLDAWYPHEKTNDMLGKIAISKKARENALKRVEKDPKEAAMQKIEAEHEALKPNEKTNGYLAPFARAMQVKYSHVLDSPVSIERRIRKLKKSK